MLIIIIGAAARSVGSPSVAAERLGQSGGAAAAGAAQLFSRIKTDAERRLKSSSFPLR